MRGSLWSVVVCVASFGAPAALGHGAADGLHLHVSPEPAAPGETITIELEAEEPMVAVQFAVDGRDPVLVRVPEASRRHRVEARLPVEIEGDTIGVRVEVETTTGRTLRAAAVVAVRRDEEALTPRP